MDDLPQTPFTHLRHYVLKDKKILNSRLRDQINYIYTSKMTLNWHINRSRLRATIAYDLFLFTKTRVTGMGRVSRRKTITNLFATSERHLDTNRYLATAHTISELWFAMKINYNKTSEKMLNYRINSFHGMPPCLNGEFKTTLNYKKTPLRDVLESSWGLCSATARKLLLTRNPAKKLYSIRISACLSTSTYQNQLKQNVCKDVELPQAPDHVVHANTERPKRQWTTGLGFVSTRMVPPPLESVRNDGQLRQNILNDVKLLYSPLVSVHKDGKLLLASVETLNKEKYDGQKVKLNETTDVISSQFCVNGRPSTFIDTNTTHCATPIPPCSDPQVRGDAKLN